jgi:NAD(P)-dependent dehydrogenase (short-subunit alcohol dehydrogenase family)
MNITNEKIIAYPALKIFSLEGKTALITGAGSGLGKEIATGLALSGASVVLVARTLGPLDELASELNAKGYNALSISADVTKKEDVQRAVNETVAKFGRIDILVNSAGTTWRSSIEDFDEDQFDRVVELNLKGTFLCMKYAGIEMLKNGGGSIINVGSGAGQNAIENSIAYCASKGGVTMLTKAAAIEWVKKGIRVNCIMPGTFKTPLLEECIRQQPDYAEVIMQKHPIGRFGELEEIVGICVYLASDNSKFMTGDLIFIDGGGNAR